MQRAARNLGFIENWANEEMAFSIRTSRGNYYLKRRRSKNIVLWDCPNIRVLAVPLEWALERKLGRG
ncbi:hypothetical protein BDV59DRAFT_172875 [Aspergillus ambiguus]|uniref:uncharacterized protein n=1 Tax=Aspergillus ambiguus TaxID=176160 RepID=UPI003CCD73D8